MTTAANGGLSAVHQLAQKGFGTGTNELYDKARPTYQSVVLEHIRNNIARGKDGLNIVEIGAGTGIFTRALLSHPAWQGKSIAAIRPVEPSAGMRDVFERSVSDSRVLEIADGTFDRTGAEDGWADLVIIAQAFHWCPDHEAAVKEFGRVLKPEGAVVLVWNLEDRDAAQWVAQLRDVYEVYEQGSPQFRLGLWRSVFSAPSYPSLFVPAQEDAFEWTVPVTLPLVQDRVCTKSYIAVQPPDEQAKVRAQVEEIVKRGEGLKWEDQKEGVFSYPYKTHVISFRRK